LKDESERERREWMLAQIKAKCAMPGASKKAADYVLEKLAPTQSEPQTDAA
jgi:hypothetical protein